MKSNHYLLIALLVTSPASFAADQTHSGQASANTVQSGSHASASVGHSIAASGMVTLVISAIPLVIGGVVSGTAGAVSNQSAHGTAHAATAPIGTPLEISNETITVMPPNEALKKPATEKK